MANEKLQRLKSKWKQLTFAILTVIAIIYFVFTGNEIDLSSLSGILG